MDHRLSLFTSSTVHTSSGPSASGSRSSPGQLGAEPSPELVILSCLCLLLLMHIVLSPAVLYHLGLARNIADRLGRHFQRARHWLRDRIPRRLSSRGKKTCCSPKGTAGCPGHRGPPPPDPVAQPPKVLLVTVDSGDPLWLDAISRLLAFGRSCRQRQAVPDHMDPLPAVGSAPSSALSQSLAPSPLNHQDHHA